MTRPSSVPPPVTAVLDASGAWLPNGLGAVETLLRELSLGYGPTLGEDATATLSAGGKRLRPLLVLLCAGPSGGEAAARAGAAIELVHMASLVHDDVLDAAPLRRGQPTVAAAAGRGRATSAGDFLFSQAFTLLAGAGDRRAVELLSDAAVSLARGELAQRRDAYVVELPEERYLERCRLKTARLFECACLMGRASANGGGSAGEDELRSFGAEIGLAFQLLDDVLDVTGPPERTGKARGTDLLDGTVNLPLIMARRRAPALQEVELRGLEPAEAELLCDRIAATGALDEVRSRALAMVASAKGRLASPAFDDEQRQLLGMVADGVVERYS
jgi:geranylgeranyl pyrophosphate synthase